MLEHRPKKLVVVDLFCGAGGMSKGFEMAGFEVLLGIDNDPECMKTFARNHPHGASNSEPIDIENLTSEIVKAKIGKREIDVIIGGPPCQGFSMAGLRDPNDPRNSLFKHFARLVYELKPKWFVMENVSGLLVAKTAKGEDVDTIIRRVFKNAGYRVIQLKLNAADYGVPQKRMRIFYIGTSTRKPIESPKPTHAETPSATLHGPPIRRWVGVGECLLPETEVEKCYYHSQKMIDGFRRRKERNLENGKGFGWQILDPKKPSYTISARYWKDGADAIVMLAPDRTRMLTERECARVQSFPDDYVFIGSKRTVYRQIGNAVPPLLAKAIALNISKMLSHGDKSRTKSDTVVLSLSKEVTDS